MRALTRESTRGSAASSSPRCRCWLRFSALAGGAATLASARAPGASPPKSRVLPRLGFPALEAARRIDLGPYAGWTEPERILFQVERAYRELRGEPYDAPIDVTALFRGMHALRESRRAVA